MELPVSLVKEFVAATNDTGSSTESKPTLYGTTVIQNDGIYVKIDGNDGLTPVSMSTDAQDGDRVIVTIENRKAFISANLSSPSSGRSATDLLTINQNGVITGGELRVAKLYADELVGTDATVDEINAQVAEIKDLTANSANITNLVTKNADIENLSTINGYIQNLTSDSAEIEKLIATLVDADQVSVVMAEIETLKANSADIDSIKAYLISAGVIQATSVETTYLEARKADIDFANVIALEASTAVIQNLLQAGGIIADDITAVTGEFTKYLTGVNISGDLINAGTISTERLIIRSSDTDEGILFAINDSGDLDQTTLTAEELKRLTLDGKLITAGTITADKIAVTDLSAFNATIGGFNLTKASIYSTNEKIILNADGTFKLGDGIQYDGTDMTIQAKTITMGGESLATATEVQVLQDQIDGAIETYFESYVPTLETEPTSTWSTDDYDKHLGDLFYIVDNEEKNGQVYRFALADGTYQWILLSDAELAKALNDAADALSAAQAAQSTADSASTAAANAQSTADSASTAASEAKSTANSASTTASEAKSTADSASTAADAATDKASTAITNAANAQSTADSAQTNISTLSNTISLWMKFDDTLGLLLGRQDGQHTILRLTNDKIQFLKPGATAIDGDYDDSVVLGYWDIEKDELTVGNISVDVDKYARFGNFAFYPRTDGSLHIKKISS